ncbi:MAG TPA: hypothetical protein VK550_11990 [Polyangiaceae bacterium]|nr:hypothetical protein [Polyangiaceae bacterium]
MSLCATLVSACSAKEPKTETYFDRTISPILQSSCVSTNTGANCHITQEHGNALGNLSLASYSDLVKRRDLLINYGPYGLPNMLLKSVDPFDIVLTAYDGTTLTVRTDIRHAGGKTLGLTTAGFHTLKAWIAGGASANNAANPPPAAERDACSDSVPTDPAFDRNNDPGTDDYEQFKSKVHPVLGQSCAAGNCHGSESNSLRLVCSVGTTDADVLARWNYFAAVRYLATRPGELATSEILRRPLDPTAGGSYHEGGAIFPTRDDPGYTAILEWANAHGPNTNIPTNRGFDFFAKRVQPMLVKKGCMAIGCHSPAMFHDYRLRGGSGGNFSVPTSATNYELTREQIALETPDPSASRLIAKNLLRADQQPGGRGILHRGGALFDDFTGSLATPQLCDFQAAETGPLDDQHAYCVVTRWIQIEREEARLTPLSGMVYVKRRPLAPPDAPQDFAGYSGSSDLCFSALTTDATSGAISGAGGACRSLIAGCTGLATQSADIRHPSVSWKGDKIAFAARSSESEPWAIWTVNVDGNDCRKDASIAAVPASSGWTDNGALVHNFDPVFAPDDRIVFVSTRGNVMNTEAFDYHGPTRTPADPSRWNANLYILERSGAVRQLTFLLNQELYPSMMSDGRLIFSAEKRALGFYQLAGRRINLDGGDYHPLYAQRGTIGFQQMTEVVELANKNLAAVFGDRGAAHGAGTIGIINRSIGPDQGSSDPADYTVDPGAIGWPVDNFYLHSLHMVDPAASGHVGVSSKGAYRSPAPLPNGQLLVSYAANATDLGSFTGNFDIYWMDAISGQKAQLTSDAATDELSAVAVYQRTDRGVFASRPDEANAHTRVYTDGEDAQHPANVSDITILDARVLGALLFQNTRSGLANPETLRKMPAFTSLDVYEDLPPAPGETDLSAHTASDAFGSLYARRRLLGSVPLLADGSARVVLPGGVPVVLRGNFELGGGAAALRFQREAMQFYPGEYAHQSFPARFFNGFCGGCHGSVSGAEVDLSLQPDILTQASRVEARQPANIATHLEFPPSQRGAEVGPVE